ncbi:MAG: hypothetical protein IPM56_08045 [Ignavibacteriales bacterium]|nr:MAG: hypothetical protein IPM56_08045 [Ignavibacteriales bacterium]
MYKGYLFFGFISIILFLTGCTSSQKIVHQSGEPIEVFSTEEAVTFSVEDNRKTSSFIISSDEWNSDYSLDQSLSLYIEDYFNLSMEYDSSVVPGRNIKVYVDQFKFEKRHIVKYSIRFIEKYSTDTAGVIRVASKYVDSTYRKKTEELIDLTLTDCLAKYFNSENSTTRIIAVDPEKKKTPQEPKVINEEAGSSDTLVTQKDMPVEQIELNEDNTTEPKPEIIKVPESEMTSEVVVIKNIPQKITLSSFGFTFIKGDKIRGGVHLYYAKARCLPEDRFILKYGAGLNYFSIENLDDGYEGFAIGGWFPLILQHFYSNNSEGAFIGVSFLLMLGNESITYGYKETNTFFIGPAIEPFVGFKFKNNLSIDGGPFFIALAGSKMLPNDFGFRINTNIWF